MISFKEAVTSGEFAITAECGPPKGTNIEEMVENIKLLQGRVHAVNATDNQAAVMRISSLGTSKIIMDNDLEPIFQMTCRDRNRLAIQSDILTAHVMGVKNILALTGDHVSAGDHKQAKAVFDLESVQLLKAIETLNSGKDMAGNDLDGAVDIFPGACVTPESNPIKPQLHKFEQKIKAGAKFFQTQAVYDLDNLESFMKYARKFDAKIIVGVLLIKSPGMANYLNNFVPGIRVPDYLIQELKEAGKGNFLPKGIEIATRTIKVAKELCDGVHIMAIGAEDKIPEILDQAGV